MILTRSDIAAYERPIRIGTLLTTALATPLLIASTVVSLDHAYWSYQYRNITAFCFGYIPLFLTVVASCCSLLHRRKTGKAPEGSFFFFADGLAALSYLGVLIPIWALEIGELNAPGYGLLAGYTTAPMIINMIVHGLMMFCTAPSALALFSTTQVHRCPNCHSSFTASESRVQETTQGGEGYSLLRGEEYLDVDADAEHYTDVQGRTSEEQIRPESESQSKEKSKKPMIEV